MSAPAAAENPVKTVFVEPSWKMRQEFADLIRHPPEGYRFVESPTAAEGLVQRLGRYSLSYHAHWTLQRLLPVNLLKPYWEQFKRLPQDVDLTYAVLHPVFRHEPWVLDMRLEQPHLLVGSEAVFQRWKGLLRRPLTSPFCRKIIFELEAGRQAFLQRLRWPGLERKCSVVHSAIPPRPVAKTRQANGVNLLFVNSANINAEDHFYAHGGRIVLEAFLQLRKRYEDVSLVIRSNLPREIGAGFAGVPNLRIIDTVIPWEQLEREFESADIFVYPTHVTPSIVFLDAMSYELPIVTTDVWGNPELVQDGRTGLLVHHPQARRYTEGFVVHFDGPEFRRVTATVDPALVEAVAEKVSVLIDNPELRRKLGSEGRHEVEEGQFSIEQRNRRLKEVLDEASASG